MGLKRWVKWFAGQLIQHLKNAFLQNAVTPRLLLERPAKTAIPG
jgi:hypothetical protein